MMLFSLFGHEKKEGEIDKFKETKKKFSKKIRTKWTGCIRRRTGLICQQPCLICVRIKPVCWRINPVCWRMKPVHQLIKQVHLILIFIQNYIFPQVFAFCQKREYYQHKKILILRPYVVLLNYIFEQAVHF